MSSNRMSVLLAPVNSRPDPHIVADQAINQVQALITGHGWSADPVLSDYGEDLIVQISFGGEFVPFRTCFQVKGTRDIEKYRTQAGFSYSGIKPNTVRRWLSSDNEVVLVLWDVQLESGVYGFAQEMFKPNEVSALQKGKVKSVSARLQVDDELNSPESVLRMAVKLMMRWFSESSLKDMGFTYLAQATENDEQEHNKGPAIELGIEILRGLSLIEATGEFGNRRFRLSNSVAEQLAESVMDELAPKFEEKECTRQAIQGELGKQLEIECLMMLLHRRVDLTGEGFEEPGLLPAFFVLNATANMTLRPKEWARVIYWELVRERRQNDRKRMI